MTDFVIIVGLTVGDLRSDRAARRRPAPSGPGPIPALPVADRDVAAGGRGRCHRVDQRTIHVLVELMTRRWSWSRWGPRWCSRWWGPGCVMRRVASGSAQLGAGLQQLVADTTAPGPQPNSTAPRSADLVTTAPVPEELSSVIRRSPGDPADPDRGTRARACGRGRAAGTGRASCPTTCGRRWPACGRSPRVSQDGVITDVPRALAHLTRDGDADVASGGRSLRVVAGAGDRRAEGARRWCRSVS